MVPQCVWVVVGGKTQLGDKVEGLYCRTVIAFPDADGHDKWKEKIDERPYLNIQVVNILEKYGTDEERRNGVDIADVLVRWILERQNNVTPEAPEQPPSVIYADNPVMQEVMKYISLSIGITSTR